MKYIITGLGKGTHQVEAKNLFELGGDVDKNELDNRYVPLEGRTTINGTKTFTEAPIVPTPTLDTHAVNKEYLENFAPSKPPVEKTYEDINELLADQANQANQEEGYFYEVLDASGLDAIDEGGAIVLLNTSTPTGAEEDYVITWVEGRHQEITPFVMRINVAANDEFQLPLISSSFYDFYVKWGDGERSDHYGRNLPNPSHTYTEAGTYDVSIRGIFPRVGYLGGTVGTTKITEILQWGDIAWERFYFNGCQNLVTLPNEAPNLYNVTQMNISFKETGITTIPVELFQKAVNVTRFDQCFKESAVTTIPSRLLQNCGAVQNVNEMFFGTNVETVNNIFDGAFSLKTAVALFREAPVNSVSGSLFDDNILLEDVSQAFFNCNLTGLPYNIFSTNKNISDFGQTFRGNVLTGVIPELWLRFPNAIGTECFRDAGLADNYSDVPESWGGNVGVPMPPQVPVDNRDYWNTATEQLQILIDGVWKTIGGGSGSSINNITEIPNRSYNDLQDLPTGDQNLTGTSIDLGNVSGNNYNYATPSSATSYTIVSGSSVVNGFARCFINTASEPTVSGATKINTGDAFIPNTDMELCMDSPNGSIVEYYFLER